MVNFRKDIIINIIYFLNIFRIKQIITDLNKLIFSFLIIFNKTNDRIKNNYNSSKLL